MRNKTQFLLYIFIPLFLGFCSSETKPHNTNIPHTEGTDNTLPTVSFTLDEDTDTLKKVTLPVLAPVNFTYYDGSKIQTKNLMSTDPNYTTGISFSVNKGSIVDPTKTIYNFFPAINTSVVAPYNISVGAYDIMGHRLKKVFIEDALATSSSTYLTADNMPTVFTPEVMANGVQFVLFYNYGATNTPSYTILPALKLIEQ